MKRRHFQASPRDSLRAERRRLLRDQTADALQLHLRVTGRKLLILPQYNHDDIQLQRWQGQGDHVITLIDRFDARSLLDYLDPIDTRDHDLDDDDVMHVHVTPAKYNDMKDTEDDEIMFERYRDLIEADRRSLCELDVIETLDTEWNELALLGRQAANKMATDVVKKEGAKIRFDYGIETQCKQQQKTEHEQAEDASTEETEDIIQTLDKLTDQQIRRLNDIGSRYGVQKMFQCYKKERESERSGDHRLEKRRSRGSASTTQRGMCIDSYPKKFSYSRSPSRSRSRSSSCTDKDSDDSDKIRHSDKEEEIIVEFSTDSYEQNNEGCMLSSPVFLPRINNTASNISSLVRNMRKSEDTMLIDDGNFPITSSNARSDAAMKTEDAVLIWKRRKRPVADEDEDSGSVWNLEDDNDTAFGMYDRRNIHQKDITNSSVKEKAPHIIKSVDCKSTAAGSANQKSAAETLKLQAQRALNQSIRACEKKDQQKELKQVNRERHIQSTRRGTHSSYGETHSHSRNKIRSRSRSPPQSITKFAPVVEAPTVERTVSPALPKTALIQSTTTNIFDVTRETSPVSSLSSHSSQASSHSRSSRRRSRSHSRTRSSTGQQSLYQRDDGHGRNFGGKDSGKRNMSDEVEETDEFGRIVRRGSSKFNVQSCNIRNGRRRRTRSRSSSRNNRFS